MEDIEGIEINEDEEINQEEVEKIKEAVLDLLEHSLSDEQWRLKMIFENMSGQALLRLDITVTLLDIQNYLRELNLKGLWSMYSDLSYIAHPCYNPLTCGENMYIKVNLLNRIWRGLQDFLYSCIKCAFLFIKYEVECLGMVHDVTNTLDLEKYKSMMSKEKLSLYKQYKSQESEILNILQKLSIDLIA